MKCLYCGKPVTSVDVDACVGEDFMLCLSCGRLMAVHGEGLRAVTDAEIEQVFGLVPTHLRH